MECEIVWTHFSVGHQGRFDLSFADILVRKWDAFIIILQDLFWDLWLVYRLWTCEPIIFHVTFSITTCVKLLYAEKCAYFLHKYAFIVNMLLLGKKADLRILCANAWLCIELCDHIMFFFLEGLTIRMENRRQQHRHKPISEVNETGIQFWPRINMDHDPVEPVFENMQQV